MLSANVIRSRLVTSMPKSSRSLASSAVRNTQRSTKGISPADSSRKVLLSRAAAGFAAGLSIALYSGWTAQRNGSQAVQCESVDDLIVNRKSDDGETMRRKNKVVNNIGDEHDPTRPKEWDDPENPMRIRMSTWVMELQDRIVSGLEELEASVPPNEHNSEMQAPKFKRDHWLRPQGGEGSSCVIRGGRVFEKGGVNVSVVHGKLPPAAIKQMRADHKSLEIPEEDKDKSMPFFAAGISIVLHPWNPHAPTIHMNYRYFELDKASTPKDALDTTAGVSTSSGKAAEPIAWWFGGGSDLTPSYLYPEDAEHFHNSIKQAADAHHTAYYPAWKKWADKYFYIPHRGESRGIGGIFFDDLTTISDIHTVPGKRIVGSLEAEEPLREPSANQIFDIVKSMSNGFLNSYVPIMKRRIHTPVTEEERRWQLIRRGRYVEFNLVYDRGTKFGLFTPGARIESILMSLPETARWEYMSDMGVAGDGTRESKIMEVLKTPRDWATV